MIGNASPLIEVLQRHDTPTICNAIEVAQGQRGFSNFTHRTMIWAGSPERRMVGFARTARIAGRVPPQEPPETIRARRIAYFRTMADGPRPALAVIEDTDGDLASGAWWGELHARIHETVCGLDGAITNGLVRDLGDLPETFPILAGSVGPSHGFVHVRETGTPVDVFGLRVCQDDLVHADRHGAVVVPSDVLQLLPAAVEKLISSEAIVLEALRNKSIDIDEFEDCWMRFEKART